MEPAKDWAKYRSTGLFKFYEQHNNFGKLWLSQKGLDFFLPHTNKERVVLQDHPLTRPLHHSPPFLHISSILTA